MAIPNFRYSFARGIELLTLADAKAIQQELYAYMNCTSTSDFSRRKRNYRNMPTPVSKGINDIFSKFGL